MSKESEATELALSNEARANSHQWCGDNRTEFSAKRNAGVVTY